MTQKKTKDSGSINEKTGVDHFVLSSTVISWKEISVYHTILIICKMSYVLGILKILIQLIHMN